LLSVSLSCLSDLSPIPFYLLTIHINTALIRWEVVIAINWLNINGCFIWGLHTIQELQEKIPQSFFFNMSTFIIYSLSKYHSTFSLPRQIDSFQTFMLQFLILFILSNVIQWCVIMTNVAVSSLPVTSTFHKQSFQSMFLIKYLSTFLIPQQINSYFAKCCNAIIHW
jgi:hypothetical protein